jgi:hypothetical protein
MGAPFVALLSADGAAALLGGSPDYSIIVTDAGKRYNAMISKRTSVRLVALGSKATSQPLSDAR